MRIWDLKPNILCRQHLLAEHRELHGLWNILTQNKKGYSKHPETNRWRKNLYGLFKRHKLQVEEMQKRGYDHISKLSLPCGVPFSGILKEPKVRLINTLKEQKQILRDKKCKCLIDKE